MKIGSGPATVSSANFYSYATVKDKNDGKASKSCYEPGDLPEKFITLASRLKARVIERNNSNKSLSIIKSLAMPGFFFALKMLCPLANSKIGGFKMKKGKILFLDKKIIDETELEKILQKFTNDNQIVEFASEINKNFYTISEATMILLKKGVKQVSAISLSLPQIEVPIYWSTF